MDLSLGDKLYVRQSRCLHSEAYLIFNHIQVVCGACYFRDGVIGEVPTRINTRETSGLFGAPAFDPRWLDHIMVSSGLVPPAPDQTMREFREQRNKQSYPSPKKFPFTSSLWSLMGFQPPLARVLVKFCAGYSELEISDQLDLSLYNVSDRLRKAVHVGQKFLGN